MKFEHNFTCFSWLLDFISSTLKMNKDEIKSCKQLNKKTLLVLYEVRLRLCETKEGCKYCCYYYLYYYCCQYKCSTAISISKVETIYYLTYQNTSLKKTNVVVSRGKEHKQKSRNTSLATEKDQYIHSYDKLVRSDIHTQVATLNVNMTFVVGGGGNEGC